MSFRVGIGYDVHRLVRNRKLILGGVKIKYHLGLLGHSDGDCLMHAIIDAIIGALGYGDIGELFPDTDNRYKDINSSVFLEYAANLVGEKGFRISNIDTTLVMQTPKLTPYKEKIKSNIACILKIDKTIVNIKAKTTEGLGYEGALLGISAYAVALLEQL